MKRTFTKRLEALEKRLMAAGECDQFGCEAELSRSLRERLEAGRRRVAAGRERRGLPPLVGVEPWDARTKHSTLVEVLHAGRERSALRQEARRGSSPVSD